MLKSLNISHKGSTPAVKEVAAAVKKLPAIIKADTANVSIRHFNDAAIDKYRSDKDFNYHITKAGVSWWDRFWAWIWHLWQSFWSMVAEVFQKLFGSVRGGQNAVFVFKYVILGLAVVAVIYCVFKLLGIGFPHLLKKQPKSTPVPYAESAENIHEISFDAAIDEALANKNYRLAVRLLYLRSLKQLSDRGLINWKIGKTNTAYINELNNTTQREQFTMVTRQFEYVWYGDFPIDGQSYQRINNIFQEFKQSLS
ncbi:uncharacterized protein DUF4129 [Mucilaginibacter oryzae]|uniref:Uncharacterized protein DUF4129 n=1 Tax=Mucilaginibacter oryzae TaxID=468058 RepID=A0A316HE22_9SPHI|nr:DUF4129 domain-containing protein [Mucilaginibacter oryzae]PWK76545.1 uncharacterized protein DUF4129 [Mucilaginibacter oryzae]